MEDRFPEGRSRESGGVGRTRRLGVRNRYELNDRTQSGMMGPIVQLDRGEDVVLENEIAVRAARVEDLETLVDFNLKMADETEGKQLDPGTLRAGIVAVLPDGPAVAVPTGRYLVAVVNRQGGFTPESRGWETKWRYKWRYSGPTREEREITGAGV